ncbi:ankyrin repeat domain-containing protein [Poseidonibacter antarcticus]|uniref:ankyrin repeat domain-containing protein n=1 Tax=Poseidonibacter antarcticus TaxID=2478538 RepID=UPI000EF4C970|nr:ankyrin repeat domain-containing protein [Poseidonibacter antarcticus]
MFRFFKNSTNESFQKELFSENIDINKIQEDIDNGIDINSLDENGKTILFSLCAKKKLEAIKILIKNGIDLSIENQYGKTVLGEAVSHGDGVIIRLLLENGFDINHKNSSKRTILQDVALEGNYKVFQILMSYHPNYDDLDSYGRTVLFDAVEGGNVNIVKELVNHMENINVVDENNETPLFKAVLKENTKIAETLILFGMNLDSLDNYKRNVLFNTILQGNKNIDILKLMIKKGININQIDINGDNIIDEILYILDLQRQTVKELLQLEGNYSLIKKDMSYLELTKIIIENGLDINKIDKDGLPILAKEVEKKNYENIVFLINCGADINTKNINGKSILFNEVIKGNSNYKMINFLVKNGADIELRDSEEKTIIDDLAEIILIQKGFKKEDLEKYPDINEEDYNLLFKKMLTFRPDLTKRRSNGRNILFDVIIYNDFDIIRLLFNYGLDPNIIDKDGNTPLSVLIDNGLKLKDLKQRELFLERLVFLLKFRVNVDIQDINGYTVFHKTVIANDLAVVEKLLTKKADLSLKDNQGRTALHHTQWNGNYKIARWLIAAGADINQADNSGFTLLNYAAILGHIELVVTLIKSGVLMYNKNKKNKKVAKFLKTKEKNLDKLLINDIVDNKMQKALEEVIENTKKEINEAIKG